MRINRKLLSVCRTLHIYLTMLGLLAVLGFGVTGFTINHEGWFGATTPHVLESQGTISKDLIDRNDSLHVVEQLRRSFHITAALSGYDDLGERLSVGFKSPSELWEIEIDKSSGKATARLEAFNFVALLNNLHRGRYSGAAWSWVIDAAAILIVLACMTGTVMWLALPKRRKLGIAFLVAGTAVTLLIIWVLVPGDRLT